MTWQFGSGRVCGWAGKPCLSSRTVQPCVGKSGACPPWLPVQSPRQRVWMPFCKHKEGVCTGVRVFAGFVCGKLMYTEAFRHDGFIFYILHNVSRTYHTETVNWFAWVGHLRTMSSLQQTDMLYLGSEIRCLFVCQNSKSIITGVDGLYLRSGAPHLPSC